MSQHRGSWTNNFGFLMAAVGSAVGLGNIWGFPYKMGANGGFSFLIIYVILAAVVGYVAMVTELAISRRAGLGVLGTYQKLTESASPVAKIISKLCAFFALFSPTVVMMFYCVLGGYCINYLIHNAVNLFRGSAGLDSATFFADMLQSHTVSVGFTVLFMLICFAILRGGIQGGIEKFNNVAMPVLAIMLVVIIIRSLTLPGAAEGLKFMFLPGYAVSAGIIPEEPSFIKVFSVAGCQMFLSLSVAMGAIITYGSYLSKEENLVKNAAIIVAADTVVALMAGLAVIPAAFALGGEGAAMQGPSLLFVTLQNVFYSMGTAGAVFGMMFYLLVLIAAITSAISLTEASVTSFVDRAHAKGKTPNRNAIIAAVICVILTGAVIVALDGLGSNGLPTPMGFIWLDFFDVWSEGIAMPLGAMLMCILVGWFVNPKYVHDEVSLHGNQFTGYKAYCFLIRFVAPVLMVFILLGQLDGFFGLGLF